MNYQVLRILDESSYFVLTVIGYYYAEYLKFWY